MYDPNNKTALVTGGTRGIGARIAEDLIDAGSNVVITGRSDTAEVRDFLAHLNTKGTAIAHFGDICGADAAEMAVEFTVKTFGGLNILVHAAGGAAGGKITEVTPERWMEAFDVHVHAVYHLFRASHDALAKDGGVMLLISSVAGLRGCPNSVAYQTVKGALPQMARALAVDHAPQGIRINAVAPGIIRTDFHAAMTEAAKIHNITNRIPMRREGTVEDVSSMAMELIRNDFITGETVCIDGGMGMRITA